MSPDIKSFVDAQRKTVDSQLPVGAWPVYPAYRPMRHEAPGQYVDPVAARVGRDTARRVETFTYVVASAPSLPLEELLLEPERAGIRLYSPLKTPGLFLEFARLFVAEEPRRVAVDRTAEEKVLDWIEHYGVLGRHATYPARDGGTISGRHDDREDVGRFVALSVEAGRSLSLYALTTNPEGLDADRLRAWGVEGETPRQLKEHALAEVSDAVNRHLESETCTRLYRKRDGTYMRGPGFHSLLGALWLQMETLFTAPEEDSSYCRWCGDVIRFEEGEPPPADAPKGSRGKHRTHSNRAFCEYKYGIKDWCKNAY